MSAGPAAYGPVETELAAEHIERQAWHLSAQARKHGLVLTVEQVNQKPLASGNHVDVVTVRPARKPDSTY